MGWLRRQWKGLVGLVVVSAGGAALLWWGYFGIEWWSYAPHEPVVASDGGSATVGALTASLVEAHTRSTYYDGSALPDGTTLVVVEVDVAYAQRSDPYCSPTLSIDGSRWDDLSVQVPDSYLSMGLGPISVFGCTDAVAGQETPLTWGFLVPSERAERAREVSVDIMDLMEYPQFVRLEVPSRSVQ